MFLLLAAALLVCIEVLSTMFRHSNEQLPEIYPPGTEHTYGVCYIIAWIIFIHLLGASFTFFICSKKRKGTFDEATEEEALANRPVDLGRSFRRWCWFTSHIICKQMNTELRFVLFYFFCSISCLLVNSIILKSQMRLSASVV